MPELPGLTPNQDAPTGQVEQARHAAVIARIAAECERLGAETALLYARIAHAEAWSNMVRIDGGRS